jgi:hypothetical protein
MNSNAPLKGVLVFMSALVPALLAEEVSPRTADSPEAQSIRDLTLIGRSVFASSPTERPAAKKVTILHLLSVQLQSRVDAIDDSLRELPLDEPAASSLKSERDGLLKRRAGLDKMLRDLATEAR